MSKKTEERLHKKELEKLTVEELEKLLDELRETHPRGDLQKVMAVRNEKVEAEQAATWGLSPEKYKEAKDHARKEGRPVAGVLNGLLRDSARKVQGVKVHVAEPRGTGHGVK